MTISCTPVAPPTAPVLPAEVTELPQPATDPLAHLQTWERRAVEVLLREAEEALLTNRLTTPGDDNALDRFLHVLVMAPGEPRAEAGLDRIAQAYVDLALQAHHNHLPRRAETLLDLALDVRPGFPAATRAQVMLGQARPARGERVDIDAADLARSAVSLAEDLARIGARAKNDGLFVVITAPSDPQARWMYQQMNAAPPPRRLRASIEIGTPPALVLRPLR